MAVRTFTQSLLVGLLAVTGAVADGLTQAYCSSQNTGSDFSAVNDMYQSDGACFDTCKSEYAFAVVQYENCWCSNYIPADQTDTSRCSQKCPGFPDDLCGNQDQGLYGYIALSRAPSGTATVPSVSQTSTPQQQQTSFASRSWLTIRPSFFTTAPSFSSEASSTTSAESSTDSFQSASSPSSSSPSPSPSPTTSSQDPTTTTPSATQTSTIPTTSTQPTTFSTFSSSTFLTPTDTPDPTPVTTIQVITVSGAAITQTVTSTPRATQTIGAGPAMYQPTAERTTNTGTIVGAVVGSVAGVALILLALLLFWRRRRNSDRPSKSSKLNRNASVLSKAGLLATGRNRDAEKSIDEPRFGSQRQSALYGDDEVSPISAPNQVYEGSGHPSRRNSRPLVYDQRLNPAALMENYQHSGSRTSVNTMQDQRDYSRPLGVTNPDVDQHD